MPPAPSRMEHQAGRMEPGSGGGVELNTNVLRGVFRFTNQNPAILQLLASDFSPLRYSGRVAATSVSPAGLEASTLGVNFLSPTEYSFEMLVEAAAGGAAGVTYDVSAWRGQYTHSPPQRVVVRPRDIQPQPTDATIESCLGVIQVRFGTDAQCQLPRPVMDVSSRELSVYRASHSSDFYVGYVQAGWSRPWTLRYNIGTSQAPVFRQQQFQVTVGCDEIKPLCIPVPAGSPPPGRVTGPFEVIGETSTFGRSVSATDDAEAGTRNVSAPLSCPVSDPSRWWTVDLAEDSYFLQASGALRSGRELTSFSTPVQFGPNLNLVTVVSGQTTAATQLVNGELRYPFVMHPAYFHGAIRLTDPYVTAHPGASSSLSALFFSADYDPNGDGLPNVGIMEGTHLYAGAWFRGNSVTSFRNGFNPATGELVSSYEQPLLNPYDQTFMWGQGTFGLRFWSEPTPFRTRPGLYDPERFRNGTLWFRPVDYIRNLGPGDRARMNHEYCFNELQLQYSTTGGRFYNPSAEVTGSFEGLDWRGIPQAYSFFNSRFYGIPYVDEYQPSPESYAQPTGTVRMALPQGTFVLRPGALMVNASGGTNSAVFAPIPVTLGCGQRLNLVPPLTVNIAPLNGCAATGLAQVSGQVKSTGTAVGRIWYRLNGGPEVTLCTNCGTDPAFQFTLPLQTCRNAITVYAANPGMTESAWGLQEIVWDDPADGASCPGAACVNSPPPPPPPPPPSDCVDLHLSDSNLFLLEDYTGGHDVQGKVAAGGNIALTDFAVGSGLPDSNLAHTLVAGGKLTLSRGGVWGDAFYGGTYSTDPSVVYPRGTVAQGTPIDFASRFAELRALSAQLGSRTANGTTTLEPWGGIMLRGTDPRLNVFQVPASAFTGAALLSLDAPAGSLAVINISGSSATFTGFGQVFSGGMDQRGVLFNFVDATAINAQGYGFWGTVLAPYARITFNNGSWDGGIYAVSLTGNAEGHINPLSDHSLCP